MFQNPHIGGSLSKKIEEDLQIVGIFWYVANYSKQMEKTWIELSGFKLLLERNEAEKQELENKDVVAQQEVLGLHNHTHAIEVQIKKTLQAMQKKLNQLQMEFIMVKQATLEQQMQSYEIIKGERNLLKENKK